VLGVGTSGASARGAEFRKQICAAEPAGVAGVLVQARVLAEGAIVSSVGEEDFGDRIEPLAGSAS